MHIILGAGGPVSNALAKELEVAGETVRLVSRRKIETIGTTTWMGADLKDQDAVHRATKGGHVIYLCAGLQYNKKVWAVEWPLIMTNVVKAAQTIGARLLFFDNVYMYGHTKGPMTEDTPYQPQSVKGSIRARIADYLMQQIKTGTVRGSIARAADFYGAESMNSFYDSMVLAKLVSGKKAIWLGNPHSLHSFTYVPDAAKAMALLGRHPESDGQVWHLPTAAPRKGTEFIQLAASITKARPAYTSIGKAALRTIGLFNKLVGETVELFYQYKYDYHFSSARFEKAFNVRPTPYEEGIAAFTTTLKK